MPSRSGGASDFFRVLVCPKASGGFGLALLCPTGLEGFRFFFKYWSAQQVWKGFGFFSSTGLPNVPGGFRFLGTGSLNGYGGFVFKYCPTGHGPTRRRVSGFFWALIGTYRNDWLAQPRLILACPTGLALCPLSAGCKRLRAGPSMNSIQVREGSYKK